MPLVNVPLVKEPNVAPLNWYASVEPGQLLGFCAGTGIPVNVLVQTAGSVCLTKEVGQVITGFG